MIRFGKWIVVVCLLSFFPNGSTVAQNQITGRNTKHFVGRIIGLSGNASVIRNGQREKIPATLNLSLYSGDRVLVTGSSRVRILCAGTLNRYESGTGEQPVRCRVSKASVRRTQEYDGDIVFEMRLPGNNAPLKVVSPRMTRILNRRPRLRWTSAPGDSKYQVVLDSLGRGGIWKTTVNAATEVNYPVDAPPLVSGETYKVIVFNDEHDSRKEDLPGLTFTLLSRKNSKAVRQKIAAIKELRVSKIQKQLLLADLYLDWSLFAESIDELESIAAKTNETSVLRTLADIYMQISLPGHAEPRYLQALAQAERSGRIEDQALCKQALGFIDQLNGKIPEARNKLREAKQLFQRLGDKDAVNWIAEREKMLTLQ